MIYIKYFNSILCISGKYTKKVEAFGLDEFNINNFQDDGKFNGSKYHKNGGGNLHIKKSSKKMDSKSNHSHHSKSREDSQSPKDHSSNSHSHSSGKNDKKSSRSHKSHKGSHSKNHRSSSKSKSGIEVTNTEDNEEESKNNETKNKHSKYSRKYSSKDSKANKSSKSIKSNKSGKSNSKEKQAENIDYLNEDKLSWEEFPELNYARNYSCFFIHNEYYLYIFFGYNQFKGYLDSIEKIDIREPKNKWELIKYQNPSKLNLRMSSMSACYAGVDEIYILGGSVQDTPSDQILTYNFKQNAFFRTEMNIPGMRENSYYRF